MGKSAIFSEYNSKISLRNPIKTKIKFVSRMNKLLSNSDIEIVKCTSTCLSRVLFNNSDMCSDDNGMNSECLKNLEYGGDDMVRKVLAKQAEKQVENRYKSDETVCNRKRKLDYDRNSSYSCLSATGNKKPFYHNLGQSFVRA